MNYDPNTVTWKPGDLVLHDADAKRDEMLMLVIGYTKDGLCRTRYSTPNDTNGDALRKRMRQKPEVWENDIRYLHDPARFNVTVATPNDQGMGRREGRPPREDGRSPSPSPPCSACPPKNKTPNVRKKTLTDSAQCASLSPSPLRAIKTKPTTKMKRLKDYEGNSGIGYTKGSGSGDPFSYSFIAEITDDESYDAEEWSEVEDFDYSEIRSQLEYLDPSAEMDMDDIVAVFVRDLSEMCSEYVVVTNW